MTLEMKDLLPLIALASLAYYWHKMLEKSRKKAKIVIPVNNRKAPKRRR